MFKSPPIQYVLILIFLCSFMACIQKNTLPTQLNEGEILFQTVEYHTLKTDTHYTLLIIKKNKVKTVYIHQRPHFATIRERSNPITQQIHLENNQRKITTGKDTFSKKLLHIKDLIRLSDTLYWHFTSQRYQYSHLDTHITVTSLKNTTISSFYAQDLPVIKNYIFPVFPVRVEYRTQYKKILTQAIRIEEKDIADIEFEYHKL